MRVLGTPILLTVRRAAHVKVRELLSVEHMQEYKLIEKHGVCIRVLGDLSLLPLSVRAAADRVMEATQHHKRGRLNICLAYG